MSLYLKNNRYICRAYTASVISLSDSTFFNFPFTETNDVAIYKMFRLFSLLTSFIQLTDKYIPVGSLPFASHLIRAKCDRQHFSYYTNYKMATRPHGLIVGHHVITIRNSRKSPSRIQVHPDHCDASRWTRCLQDSTQHVDVREATEIIFYRQALDVLKRGQMCVQYIVSKTIMWFH